MSDIEKETYIDDTSSAKSTNEQVMDIIDNDESNIDDTALDSENAEVDTLKDETITDEDDSSDDSEEKEPIFAREDWADKVRHFEEDYPIATKFAKEIGDSILKDDNLWQDEKCLEKALIRVLSENYVTDAERAISDDFLENYIYNNEAIKDKIVDEYMEELDALRLPSTMSKGGRISLSNPMRPKTINEAGALAEKMMRR